MVCQAGLVWGTGTGWLVAALVVACLVAGWLALALGRSLRRYQRAMQERGWLLERERASASRAAVDAERARIARELHDIVSHNVSLMVVQASAAREVLDTMPEEAAAALRAVEEARPGIRRRRRGRRDWVVTAAESEPAQPVDRPDRVRRVTGGGADLR